MDWREFVETMSVVEQKLREDPGGVYARMDFATRDRYRHVVEKIAKASGLPESEVARKAIQLAHESAARTSDDDRAAHVGFYLVDNGLPQLERTVNAPLSLAEALRKTGRRFPLFLYLGAIALFTAILTASLAAKAHAGARCGLAAGAGRDSCRSVRKPSCGRDRELAGHAAGDAAPAAANGFFRRDSARIPHPGGGAVLARERPQTSRTWSRRWKSGSWQTVTPISASAC